MSGKVILFSCAEDLNDGVTLVKLDETVIRQSAAPEIMNVHNSTAPIFVTLILLFSVLPATFADEKPGQPVIDSPLPPNEAAATMKVPLGFQVSLFAGEPDVKQPIAFCIDDRGRLWVCEATNYPDHGLRPGDRILIFEDSDNDGTFDKRTVFYDQLNYVTGIEVGFGGAWVMSPPYFYFIPDADKDDVPDAEPTVLLDGFGNHANSHNLANGFAWGPDGFLYGTHGRTNFSQIGKPGSKDEERIQFDGGVWRYHPVTHEWEPFCDGTTNPWGIDWNDFGEAFMTNCVNPHLFHAIEGAHYEPWRNRKSSEFAYQRIETIADHLHYVEGNELRENLGSEEVLELGGGHAHCGSMIYLGDSFPEKYRNTVFMNNIHGHRINNDFLQRKGSGYTASHWPNFMISKDAWYMGVNLRTGPDGSVFATDWSDTGECHSVRNTQKETGRIYKISYGKKRPPSPDLATLSNSELVGYQTHKNDWYVRHARRLLHERAAAGDDMKDVHAGLFSLYQENPDITRKLRALWALQVTGGLSDGFLVTQLSHENEHLRAWAVRLLCLDRDQPEVALEKFRELAESGDSPLVRLHLCSALQRIEPAARRWDLVAALAAREEDAADHNLPLMLWYAMEPLIHEDPQRFLTLGYSSEIPLIREHVARRVTEKTDLPQRMDWLTDALTNAKNPSSLLSGILTGLQGVRELPMPKNWSATFAHLQQSDDVLTEEMATRLALIFNDKNALAALHTTVSDQNADPAKRNRSLSALIDRAPRNLAAELIQFADDPAIRSTAIRGLANFQHPDTSAKLLALYPKLNPAEKQDALQTLAAKPEWALAMLDAVEANTIPPKDLSAFTARQLQNLNDPAIAERVKKLWGEMRKTPAEKKRLIESYRRKLPPESIASAERSAGRAHFQKLCAACHQMFGEGGKVGPELTGSQRTNLDYLLENIIDPSASVSKDFRMNIIETTTGRTLSGFIAAENDQSITVQSINEAVVIPVKEIKKQTTSPVSIMPEGLIQTLSTREVKELIAYLSSPHQVNLK